ncbi:hypothetical protein P3X46_021270 [Hevea brasiliensis]|uniref:RNase H type-1 domain-containing protein n=1 Tax=Hevea brasiliensis TaxID=3981 RepID=A0ABQ9LG90_HEVBR|nr:hypothetical protein P3X46_021270 [Hevea brasiliensis]
MRRYKCNFDGAVFAQQSKVGWGAVIRDHMGNFIVAFTSYGHGVFNLKMTEGLGFKEVLSWLIEQNISNVDVETDCLDLVHAFNSTYEDIFEFGSLLNVCKRIGGSINGFTFAWVRRQANVVAHLLANASTSYAYPKFWSMPLFIHDA